jgi:hypothetical protein
MSDSPYSKLQEFLDRFPLGFPRTDSGVEIRILRNLFTEEEARVAVLLSPMPEERPPGSQVVPGSTRRNWPRNWSPCPKEG